MVRRGFPNIYPGERPVPCAQTQFPITRQASEIQSVNTSAFLGPDPKDEPTTFRLPVTWGQAGSSNAGTYITILPAVPHLELQAIPRPAIPNCTNHFSVVNTLGESGFDSACSIEGFQLFGGEFHIQTGEIVLELRYLPRSYDRDYWHRSMPQPGERDLRHAATGLFGD